MDASEPLFTMAEAALRMAVSYSTVKRLVRSGELAHVRVSVRVVRVPESAIHAYLHPEQPRPLAPRRPGQIGQWPR